MEQKEFLKLCTSIFKQYGFEKHNSNYYKIFDDIILVFGLQKSSYGGKYYYLEYGFVFPSINKHMPYPKYHQANIRQGRMSIDGNYAIEYEVILSDTFREHLTNLIEKIVKVVIGGKKSIIDYSILGKEKATLIIGYDTLPYLGIDKSDIHVAPEPD